MGSSQLKIPPSGARARPQPTPRGALGTRTPGGGEARALQSPGRRRQLFFLRPGMGLSKRKTCSGAFEGIPNPLGAGGGLGLAARSAILNPEGNSQTLEAAPLSLRAPRPLRAAQGPSPGARAAKVARVSSQATQAR